MCDTLFLTTASQKKTGGLTASFIESEIVLFIRGEQSGKYIDMFLYKECVRGSFWLTNSRIPVNMTIVGSAMTFGQNSQTFDLATVLSDIVKARYSSTLVNKGGVDEEEDI